MIPLAWCRWTFIGIIILQVIWFAWLFPPEVLPSSFVTVAMITPLCLFALGVWRLNTRALVLAGFVLLLYFSLAVAETYAHETLHWAAIAQIMLITIYFMALLAIRRTNRSK